MNTLLSVKITESQKGEFPDLTDQLGSFPSVPDFTDFTSLSSAVRRYHQADARLVLWSAVGCQL